ncbi:13120_t:CDS:2, partial [Acaulospora morrowiae]
IVASMIAEYTGKSADEIFGLLELPRNPELGDITIAVPRLRIKENPVQLAQQLVKKFVPNEYIIDSSQVDHYLNFRYSHPLLTKSLLTHIYEKKEIYGTNKSGEGKTCVIDYSSPNIAKPFHAGHLRSTIIGNFVKNVHAANGWKTIGLNYLGDWGKQYGLLAVGFEKYGSEEELLKNPIKHLYDIYVKTNAEIEKDATIDDQARAYFKKMEDGDEEALALWNKFRNLSIEKYKETYARLNIDFDVYSGESQISNDKMMRGLDILKEKNIVKESEGALIVDLKKYKLDVALVQKNDGTTLYITRDIGAAMERYEKYKFDAMYYVVASQQDLHFKQLFKILELMEIEWVDRCKHINFGMVKGMSTRKGTAVFLDEILDQTKESMHEVMRQNEKKYSQIGNPEYVSDVIGISAVMVQDMSAKRIRNYEFDWNRMFSFEGDTGPYLQYAHARLCSIERNSGLVVKPSINFDLLNEKPAIELISMIAQYPDVVKSALYTLEPCTVLTYAMKLSHVVSVAVESLWVMGVESQLAEARLLMFWATRITLGNALKLLGLKPLER